MPPQDTCAISSSDDSYGSLTGTCWYLYLHLVPGHATPTATHFYPFLRRDKNQGLAEVSERDVQGLAESKQDQWKQEELMSDFK